MISNAGAISVDLRAVPPEAIALLRQCGSTQRPHSGRTLFIHLAGTYGLLRSWGNPEWICLGGLFHSIYGTNAFRHQSLPEDQRSVLQALIGAQAEHLAWSFCHMDRPRAILAAIKHQSTPAKSIAQDTHPAGPAATNKQLQASDWIALAEIEAANLLEQADIGRSVRDLFCLGLEQPGVLSQAALTALQQALAKQLQARQPTQAPRGIHATQGAHP